MKTNSRSWRFATILGLGLLSMAGMARAAAPACGPAAPNVGEFLKSLAAHAGEAKVHARKAANTPVGCNADLSALQKEVDAAAAEAKAAETVFNWIMGTPCATPSQIQQAQAWIHVARAAQASLKNIMKDMRRYLCECYKRTRRTPNLSSFIGVANGVGGCFGSTPFDK